MTVPLLGPFRLTARSFSSPAGVVYSAFDPAGAPLEVVVLTRGAASDAAARDRFAAAVRDFDGMIVASDTESTEPWAAGGPGLARTLEPVLLHGRARGPQFLPYWAGVEDPAFPTGRSAPLLAPKGERPRGVIPAVVTLVLLAILLGGLLGLLFACQPDDPLRQDNSERTSQDPNATGSDIPSKPFESGTPNPSGTAYGPVPPSASEFTTRRPSGSPSPGSGSPSTGSGTPGQNGAEPSASGGDSGVPDGPNGEEGGDSGSHDDDF